MDSIPDNQLKNLIDIFFKRKKLITTFFLSTLLTALIGGTFLQKELYEAYSKILIEVGRGYVPDRSLPVNDQKRVASGLNMEQQVDLALQVLNDNTVSSEVIEKIGATVIYEDLLELEQGSPGLMGRLRELLDIPQPEKVSKIAISRIAAARLQEDIIVSRAGRLSSIIYIAFRHEDPFVAAEVVNTLVNLYVNRHLELRKKPRLTRFFQEQFNTKKTELATAENDLQEFKERYDISSSSEEERQFIIKKVEKHKADLDETAGRTAELVTEIKQLRFQLANTAKNPEAINALHAKLVKLQVRESELTTNYNEDSRTMRGLRAEIQRTRYKLDELGYNKRYGTDTLKDQSLYGDLQKRLLKTEIELDILNARKATLQSQLNQYVGQLQKLGSVESKFRALEEQLSMARNRYRLYQTKFEEFRISDALDAEGIANVKVLEAAQAPYSPIPPKTTLIIVLSLFFGGIGSISLALIMELASGTLRKKEDTERYLKRPVLATIPEFNLGGATQGASRKAVV